jgi:lipopolysaccharide transport system permease protein
MQDEAIAARPLLVLRPTTGWRALDLRELWTYRELLMIFAWRDLKVRYRQTFLGAAWVIGQPLISMLIFTLLFNRVAKIAGIPGIPYPIFVLSGLLIWNFFSNAVAKAAASLIGQGFLISKVYFPRLVIPLSGIAVDLTDLAVAGVLLAGLMVWYGVVPAATAILLPVILLIAIALAVGVGLWLAALNVEYRDLRILIPFVLQIAMYATPVVYPLAALPEKFRLFVRLNPMAGVVEGFRAALFGTPLPVVELVTAAVIAFVLVISGLFYFRRMERQFADVL